MGHWLYATNTRLQSMKLNMKNIKFMYYMEGILRGLVPRSLFRRQLQDKLASIANYQDAQYIHNRVSYYNQATPFSVDQKDETTGYLPIQAKDFKINEQIESSVYYFDLYRYLAYFSDSVKFHYWPGDKIVSPSLPNIVKSRPVQDNHNSVLMNLDRVRHFNFINDPFSYDEKKNMAVWRGASWQTHRVTMLKNLHGHPLCDAGSNKPVENNPYKVDFMPIREQLRYKFVLCPEGNDVATNLKWVMSSNSVAIMSRPKYETWFMEGQLEAGTHYIEVKDDYSDAPEKIDFYLNNPDQVKEIVRNANQHVQQFSDKDREDLIALMVLEKYFSDSGQL